MAARFSGNWEQGLDRDEQGTVFLNVDPYCFQQILQYLKLRMNHPAKEVPLPAIPHDKHFAYASLVKFFCLEEYMGYWAEDKLDFSDTQPGIIVLGQQALVLAADGQSRSAYIGRPMQPKQVYYLKCKVDQECQVVGICTKEASDPDVNWGIAAECAETFGWGISEERFVEGRYCMKDNFIYGEGNTDSDDSDSDDEGTQDLVVWKTGTVVTLKANFEQGILTLRSPTLAMPLTMEIPVPGVNDSKFVFQVVLGSSAAKLDLLAVTASDQKAMEWTGPAGVNMRPRSL